MSKIYYIGTASGNSMRPLINREDKLYINKPQINELRMGDIIIFYDRKNFISHRLVKITADYLIAKGDNTPFYDKPLKFSDVLGKVVKIEGKNGFISMDSLLWKLSKFYFLFYSLSTYFATRAVFRIISVLFFGRYLLVNWLRKKK